MLTYDEKQIVARIARLEPRRRSAFAAACAEALLPLYARYFRVQKSQIEALSLADVVDTVWLSIESGARGADLHHVQADVESLVPSDPEDSWVWESGLAQSAVAAVAYAVGSLLDSEPRVIGWASRQVHEVADYVAVKMLGGDSTEFPLERDIAQSLVVQYALESLERWLSALEAPGGEINAVRENARAAGVWLDSVLDRLRVSGW